MNTKLIYTCSNCGKKFEFDEKYTKDIVLKTFFTEYPCKCENCLILYYGNLYSNALKKIIEMKRKGYSNGKK